MEPWGQDDRGQIIVVAALLLAVLFVGLALVLNSAIYAENIATRGDTSTSDAMAVDAVTEERLQASIYRANYYSDTAGFSDRRTRVLDNVTDWDGLAGANQARHGQAYSVETSGMTEGARVIQNDTNDFLPGDSDLVDDITGITVDPLGIEDRTTWVPAPESKARNFRVTADRTSLKEVSGSPVDFVSDFIDGVLTGSNMFWVQTERTDGDGMWRVYLLDDSDNSSVAAVVTEYSDTNEEIKGVCRAQGESVTVNMTAGRLTGDSGAVACPVLRLAFGSERNNIYFVGADEISGSYQFIVDHERGSFEDKVNKAHSDDGLLGSLIDGISCLLGGCDYDVYRSSPSNSEPYTTTAIYGVQVKTTYQDGRITYTRNVTYPPTAR